MVYDMIPKTWMIEGLKMFEILEQVLNIITNVMDFGWVWFAFTAYKPLYVI